MSQKRLSTSALTKKLFLWVNNDKTIVGLKYKRQWIFNIFFFKVVKNNIQFKEITYILKKMCIDFIWSVELSFDVLFWILRESSGHGQKSPPNTSVMNSIEKTFQVNVSRILRNTSNVSMQNL